MIALVGSRQTGELVRVSHPVKVAAVDDRAADADGVTVHVLGGGVCHDVRAELDRAAVDGRREGVVHDEGHTVGMRETRELLDIKNRNGGIGDSLAEHRAGVGTELRGKLFLGQILIHEGDVNSHLLHGNAEQVVGAAVNRGGSDDVAACLADVEQGKEVCRLSAGGQHCRHTALQSGELRCDHVVGGILQTGVEIAACLEVKQLAHIVA